MSLQRLPTPFGYTIFCDDIRHEIDGKTSFIGAYRSAMQVSGNFPAIIPKFGVLVTYIEKSGDHEGPVILKVFLPGDSDEKPTVSFEIPGLLEARRNPPKEQLPEGYELPEPSEPALTVEIPMILAPMLIKQAGHIRVRAECDNRTYKLGALMVRAEAQDISE